MKYAPGSFSKNFAWHGTGLRKLHAAIVAGFKGGMTAVGRETWRQQSGIGDSALELIPINFFLHNAARRISVDELVYQAITNPHSLRFDRLALFAFHLNRVGSPPNGSERPAMWANEFVRERLWNDGAWRRDSLPDAVLDTFIQDRMQATLDVRIKCRNNYRHLFELCEYWPASLPIINAGADQWIASALFLAWDRLVLDHGAQSRTALTSYTKAEELHKLMGIPLSQLSLRAEPLARLYLDAGALSRFASGAAIPDAPLPELPEEAGSDWLEQEETDEAVERRTEEVQAQVRNRKKAAALKRHYANTCMICGVQLQVGRGEFYSEAAHIRPLGKPHDGPDKTANMLILCPNHHLQFDRGVLRITKQGSDYVVISKVSGDPLGGRKIGLKHQLDDDCVRWHREWFGAKRT